MKGWILRNHLNLEEIYQKIPRSTCKEGCFACCTNSVQCTPSESVAMGGYLYDAKRMICSHLIDGKCSVYENRPFICRMYGASVLLQCEHCTPERYLSAQETNDLVHAYVLIKTEEETKKMTGEPI